MASIKGSVYLLLFSFLMKVAQCTLTTTKEPEIRPFITSDNIPPIPSMNETDSDILTPQESSNESDETGDEMEITSKNSNSTDEDTGRNMEERGLFNHLTKTYPIKSKPVYRQLNGLNMLMNNYDADVTQDATSQDRHQRSPQDRFGGNSLLFSSNRGRQHNQALTRLGSSTTEESSSISNNRRINQQQDRPISIVGDNGIQQTGDSNRGRQYNEQGYQQPNNQDRLALDIGSSGSVDQPIGDGIRDRQYNTPSYQNLNDQDRFPFDIRDKGTARSINQPTGDTNRGKQYNGQGNQQLKNQDRFPLDTRDKGTSGFINRAIDATDSGKEYNGPRYQQLKNQERFPFDASRNRETNRQNVFSDPTGREKDIIGSPNLPFSTQYNTNPRKEGPVTCNRRGICNTVTQRDLFQNTYKLIEQFSSDQYETTMCFTEIIYVTEIDLSDTLLISRDFVWTIETTDQINNLDVGSCSNFLDVINNPPMELVNTERLEGRVVKEYRIKHCGAGNIFKHEYSSWPNNDRRMIQVTVSNSSLLQCRRQQDRNPSEGRQYTTTLNPLTYRSTFEDDNRNTYVTEMPKPSSNELPTSDPGETVDATRITPGPPVVQAQRGVVEFDDDSAENSEENLKDYMKIIIDCVLKNKNFKGMCPHSGKSRD